MSELKIGRRAALVGVIVALDPVNLGWLTAAGADPGIRVPDLDGELVTDEDYGHIVYRMPRAVLRPGSVRDISRPSTVAATRTLSWTRASAGWN